MRYVLVILAVFIVGMGHAQQEKRYIRYGNYLYNDAFADSANVDSTKLQEAEVAYRKALEINPDSKAAAYNLASSLYKQKKFEDAIAEFQILSSKIKDKEELAKVYHNLGNSYLGGQKLEEAIDAYKDALRNNPKDMETKYNLAFAQHLKNNKDQQQPQQQQQEQEQDQNEEQEKDQQQQQQDEQKQEEKKEEQRQQQQKNEMSKEDAERMLKAAENDEKDLQEKLKKEKAKATRVNIEKDW